MSANKGKSANDKESISSVHDEVISSSRIFNSSDPIGKAQDDANNVCNLSPVKTALSAQARCEPLTAIKDGQMSSGHVLDAPFSTARRASALDDSATASTSALADSFGGFTMVTDSRVCQQESSRTTVPFSSPGPVAGRKGSNAFSLSSSPDIWEGVYAPFARSSPTKGGFPARGYDSDPLPLGQPGPSDASTRPGRASWQAQSSQPRAAEYKPAIPAISQQAPALDGFTRTLMTELAALKKQNEALQDRVSDLQGTVLRLTEGRSSASRSSPTYGDLATDNGALHFDHHAQSGIVHSSKTLSHSPQAVSMLLDGPAIFSHSRARYSGPVAEAHTTSLNASRRPSANDTFNTQPAWANVDEAASVFKTGYRAHLRAQADPFESSAHLAQENALSSDYAAVGFTSAERSINGPSPTSDAYDSAAATVARVLTGRSQEPSIALQHQLKTGSPTRRREIMQAMAPYLPHLAEDKHGNFLVQRAIAIDESLAWQLQGQFVRLSLSQFGCHVVQTILQQKSDVWDAIVDELVSDRLYETLTCRHSIHVWQQVLELSWKDEKKRQKIFVAINNAMRGRWAHTAMLETGSIICQNIFESAGDAEKRECLDEILSQLCTCAANQWGVWVVQHIIEHGEETIREKAFAKLLTDPVTLCISQYGQKAIMSALKSGSSTFIDGFIDVVCEKGTGTAGVHSGNSRRSILVDVAKAPQGLQIITQLITSVNDEQRDLIIKTVRRNSVFLKGTKAGLKVHQLCERARAYKGY